MRVTVGCQGKPAGGKRERGRGLGWGRKPGWKITSRGQRFSLTPEIDTRLLSLILKSQAICLCADKVQASDVQMDIGGLLFELAFLSSILSLGIGIIFSCCNG